MVGGPAGDELDRSRLGNLVDLFECDCPIECICSAGKTLSELKLRNTFEITVLTVNRGDKNVGNPAGDFKLEPGDRLVMVGLASRFADAAEIFREAQAPEEFEG